MPKDGEHRINERYHIYDCKRCGKHIQEWVNVQIPHPLKYCFQCALIVIDEVLADTNECD